VLLSSVRRRVAAWLGGYYTSGGTPCPRSSTGEDHREDVRLDRPDATYWLPARALSTAVTPPVQATGAVIATASTISDLAAEVFAARFYKAVASALPLGKALEQGWSRLPTPPEL
jgi:hypothetical protein